MSMEKLGEEAAEADTVRGRNGVVKGIAVRGRMVAENQVAIGTSLKGKVWVPAPGLAVSAAIAGARPLSLLPPKQDIHTARLRQPRGLRTPAQG